jgi:hypothetical protein
MLIIGNEYKMCELLLLVAKRLDRQTSYSVYWQDLPQQDPSPESIVLVEHPSIVTDEDAEIFPDAVRSRGWWIYCSDELLQDVVDLAVEQKTSASAEEILKCLRYYLEHDDFLDLNI